MSPCDAKCVMVSPWAGASSTVVSPCDAKCVMVSPWAGASSTERLVCTFFCVLVNRRLICKQHITNMINTHKSCSVTNSMNYCVDKAFRGLKGNKNKALAKMLFQCKHKA